MEAVVSKIEPIMEKIEEGGVYQISNFDIIENTGAQRYTRHEFRIILHSGSIIAPAVDDCIPLHGWDFFDIENIMSVGDKFGYLVDVIGVLGAASKEKLLIKSKRVYKMMVVDILDSTGKCTCVLIGDMVDSVSRYLAMDWIKRPTIGLRYVDVRSVDGKTSISCIPYVSKIYINHVYEEDWTVGQGLLGVRCDIPVDYIGSFDCNVDVRHDMLECKLQPSIAKLLTIKERGVAVVRACINGFINDCPWYYNSCWCHMELQLENDVYRCNRCYRDIDKTMRRYCIKLEVFDGYDNTIFVLNDAQVNRCVGMQCEELLSLIKDSASGEYPLLLQEKLLSKELLFKVRTGAGTTYLGEKSFEVMRICDDVNVISMFNSDELVVTPVQAKFCPPFPEYEVSLGDVSIEDNADGKVEEIFNSCGSNLAAIYSSCFESDSSHGSINQLIAHRPLKRKLFEEFEAADKESVRVLESGEKAFSSKLFEKAVFFTKGECSRIHAAESDEKSVDHEVEDTNDEGYNRASLNLIEEEMNTAMKCHAVNDGQQDEDVSDEEEVSFEEKKLKHFEVLGSAHMDDESDEFSQQEEDMNEVIDVSDSSMNDNFVMLVEDSSEEEECIEVVYLSD